MPRVLFPYLYLPGTDRVSFAQQERLPNLPTVVRRALEPHGYFSITIEHLSAHLCGHPLPF